MYAKLPYHPQRDLQAVVSVAQVPLIFVVQSSLPVKTMGEFIAWARAQGDKVHWSSAGHGSTGHLTGELFKSRTGLRMTHIPYKGAARHYKICWAVNCTCWSPRLRPWTVI